MLSQSLLEVALPDTLDHLPLEAHIPIRTVVTTTSLDTMETLASPPISHTMEDFQDTQDTQPEYIKVLWDTVSAIQDMRIDGVDMEATFILQRVAITAGAILLLGRTWTHPTLVGLDSAPK